MIWFLIGLGLLLLEFAVPGLVILFFGIGAWVVSLTTWLGLTDSTQSQILVFSVASLVCLFTLRNYVKAWFVGDSKHEDDEFETEFIGQHVTVRIAIPEGNGHGKIELKGADWNAVSDQSFEVGEVVKVTARDGLTLTVTKA